MEARIINANGVIGDKELAWEIPLKVWKNRDVKSNVIIIDSHGEPVGWAYNPHRFDSTAEECASKSLGTVVSYRRIYAAGGWFTGAREDLDIWEKGIKKELKEPPKDLKYKGDEVLFSRLEEEGISRDSLRNALLAMKGWSTVLSGIEGLFKQPGSDLVEYFKEGSDETCEEVLNFDLCETLDIVRSDLEVLF